MTRKALLIRHLETAALSAAGALLFITPNLSRLLSWVSLIALVPWAFALAHKRFPGAIWWVTLGYYFSIPPVYSYLFGYGLPVPFLYGLLIAPLFVSFPIVTHYVARRSNLPLAVIVPIAWTGMELIQTHLVLGHGSIYLLGYQLAPYRFLNQTADIGGVYLASFVAASVSGASADIYLWIFDKRTRKLGRALTSLGVSLGLVAGSMSYSYLRVKALRFEPGPSVALVQPNLKRSTERVLESMLLQSSLTLDEVKPGSVDLVIWPENAIMDFIDRPDKYLDDLKFLGTELDADFLVGAMGRPADDTTRSTNTAYLVSRDGQIMGHYDKNMLVAWGEYLPGQSLLEAIHPKLRIWHQLLAAQLLGYTPNGVPGDGMVVLESAGIRISPLICFENTLPTLSRQAVRQGADVLINITSEGRLGGGMQDHLLGITVFRAIETRRTLVRAGNAGVSGLISPDGRVYAVLRGRDSGGLVDEEGVLTERLRLNRDKSLTLYTRYGDVFAWLCLAANAVLLLAPRRGGGSA